MTERGKGRGSRAGKRRLELGKLELNKETVQELTDEEADAARGGMLGNTVNCAMCTAGASGCAAGSYAACTGGCVSARCVSAGCV